MPGLKKPSCPRSPAHLFSSPLTTPHSHLIVRLIKDMKGNPVCRFRDLSEQIKKVTKDVHVRAESTELMLSFQRGQVNLQQYKVLKSRPRDSSFTSSS